MANEPLDVEEEETDHERQYDVDYPAQHRILYPDEMPDTSQHLLKREGSAPLISGSLPCLIFLSEF